MTTTKSVIVRRLSKFQERIAALGETINEEEYIRHYNTFLILQRMFLDTFGRGDEYLALAIEDLEALGHTDVAKIGYDIQVIEEILDEKFKFYTLVDQKVEA